MARTLSCEQGRFLDKLVRQGPAGEQCSAPGISPSPGEGPWKGQWAAGFPSNSMDSGL